MCTSCVIFWKKYTHTSFMTLFLCNQATFSESRPGLSSSTIDQTRLSDVDDVDDWTTTKVASSTLSLLMPPYVAQDKPFNTPKTTLAYVLDFGLIFSVIDWV